MLRKFFIALHHLADRPVTFSAGAGKQLRVDAHRLLRASIFLVFLRVAARCAAVGLEAPPLRYMYQYARPFLAGEQTVKPCCTKLPWRERMRARIKRIHLLLCEDALRYQQRPYIFHALPFSAQPPPGAPRFSARRRERRAVFGVFPSLEQPHAEIRNSFSVEVKHAPTYRSNPYVQS